MSTFIAIIVNIRVNIIKFCFSDFPYLSPETQYFPLKPYSHAS